MKTESDVFICYNSQDKLEVREVVEALQKQSVKVWFDEQNLVPGKRWIQELEQQISTVGAVAVFIGKQGVGPWQSCEIESFLEAFVSNKCLVIPVILKSVIDDPNLPVFLRQINWIDLRQGWQSGVEQLGATIKGSTPLIRGHQTRPSNQAERNSKTAEIDLDDTYVEGNVENIGVKGALKTPQQIKATTKLKSTKIMGSVTNACIVNPCLVNPKGSAE